MHWLGRGYRFRRHHRTRWSFHATVTSVLWREARGESLSQHHVVGGVHQAVIVVITEQWAVRDLKSARSLNQSRGELRHRAWANPKCRGHGDAVDEERVPMMSGLAKNPSCSTALVDSNNRARHRRDSGC